MKHKQIRKHIKSLVLNPKWPKWGNGSASNFYNMESLILFITEKKTIQLFLNTVYL